MKRLQTLILTAVALIVVAFIAHASDTNTVLSVGGGHGHTPGAVTKVVSSGSTPTEIIDQTTRSIENGDIKINTLGKGLVVKAGANGRLGQASLAGALLVVSNSTVTSSTRPFLTRASTTGTMGHLSTTNFPAGFCIISSVNETNTINWWLLEAQ